MQNQGEDCILHMMSKRFDIVVNPERTTVNDIFNEKTKTLVWRL